MQIVLASTFSLSFLLCVVLTLIVRALARELGFMDHPGGRKGHRRSVALGGGVALSLACMVPLVAIGLVGCWSAGGPSSVPGSTSLAGLMGETPGRFPVLLWVLAGGVLFVLLGLWDDVLALGARPKLAAPVSMSPGLRITLFIGSPVAQVVVTTLWIVVMINGFNLLDNMDGQSGVVAFLTGGALLVLALQTGQYMVACLLLALLGAVLGFLLFNLPPASIFAGDAGAMFMGYILAMSTTLSSFITKQHANRFFPLLVPLVIFAVPLYDTVSVLAIRLQRGRPLLEGDRNHFAHRLLRLGLSERMVLLTLALVVLATAPGATIPYGSSTWRVVVPAAQTMAVMCVVVILEVAGGRKNRRGGRDD
jgi:UDP-GlcNAc:undecaprenyl-phosphate GlcNAc-1-phosphate transferase